MNNVESISADLRDEANSIVNPRDVPMRFSLLKQMARSPLHLFHAVQVQQDETLAMRLGAGTHAMLFGQRVVLWDGDARRGKSWEAFKSDHPATPILNRREWAEAEAICNAVRSCDLAMRLLDGAIVEQRIDWSWQGRAFRSTPDARTTYTVTELKTTKCSDPERFARDAIWRHYNCQLSLYQDAIKEAGLGAPHEAYVIAVESVAPHPVTVLRLTERALDQGRRLCRLWFERLQACESANEWPAYVQSVVDLDVPEQDAELVFGDTEEDQS